MINRRRPIQSIVAGRKMFSNGGVVPPPMGAPPMGAPPMGAPPMGAPPMGILNSSPELAQAASFSQPPPTLVDSMVNEATAGYGQGLQDSTAMNAAPVPMAHGGLASEDMIKSYSHGGAHLDSGGATIPGPNESVQAPRIQGSSLYSSGYTPNPYGSEVAIRSLSPSGQAPLSVLQAETDSERLNRLFPEALASSMTKPGGQARTGAPSITRQMLGKIPGRAGTFLEDVTKNLESAANYVDSFLSQRFRGQEDILKYLFSEEEEKSGRSLGERRALTEMISRRPDLADKILDASVPLIGKHDDSQKFTQELAKSLSLEFESGAVLNASGIDDVTSEDQLVTGERYNPPEPVRINQFAVPSGDEESDYIDSVNEMIRAYGESMKSNDPNAQTVFAQELMARTDLTDEFKQAVLQSANEEGGVTEITQDVTTSDSFSVNAAQPPVETSTDPFTEAEKRLLESPIEEDAGGLDYEAKSETDANAALRRKPETGEPPVPEGPDEYGTREGPFGEYMSDEDSREDLIKGQLRQVFGNYDIAQEFEGKKTKKENIRDIQFFKDRFKEAMPEYKGMSDSEKWFAVAEAGLRIMAGKSPNAITNIAEGLKGLGPELSKDAKERRAYDRQVDLSAAKYAVESVNTDETRAAALAKEGRVQKTFVVGKSFTDPTGTFRPAGSLYRPDTAFTRTEQFSRNILPNLTTEGIWKEILDNKGKLPKLIRQIASGKGSPTIPQLEKSFKEYNTLTDEARNSAKMLTMIDSSILINAAGNATGLTTWASSTLNKLKNSVGMKKELSILGKIGTDKGEQSQQFRYQQQVIANMMLKEILGEGSKNVSNIDRDLAQQIVGLMSEWDSISTDENLLNRRLQNIRLTVYNGLESRMRQMKSKEFSWQNVINTAGIPVQEEFSSLRGQLKKDLKRLPGVATKRSKGQQTGALRISDFYDFNTGKLKKKLPR